MSRFHRVDDIYEMESARFFRLAERVPRYEDSVTRARILEDAEKEGASGTEQGQGTVKELPDSAMMAEMPDLFEVGQG